MELQSVDIVFAIPTFNHASNILSLIKSLQCAIKGDLSKYKSVLLISDAHSNDHTLAEIKKMNLDIECVTYQHPVYPVHKILSPYHGIPAKNIALQTIFEIARSLNSQLCCVLNANVKEFLPDWLSILTAPVLEKNMDFIVPLYSRHKYDGTIAKLLVYPVTRAVYGKKFMQPLTGEYVLSSRLINHLLNKNIWDSDLARVGIDLWISTTAICDGFNIAHTCLGQMCGIKNDLELSTVYSQIARSLFILMESYFDHWKQVNRVEPTPMFGSKVEILTTRTRLNLEKMINTFRLGTEALVPFLEMILDAKDLTQLQRLAKLSLDQFDFPDDLWARVVYDFAAAFHNRIWPADQLLKSMVSIYLGRTVSFILKNQNSNQQNIEQNIEHICVEFENNRNYLLKKWGGS